MHKLTLLTVAVMALMAVVQCDQVEIGEQILLNHNNVKRQAAEEEAQNRIVNPAEFYSDQYPAMFNILFWTSLILGLTVFGIAYSMWSMDPGLDTVIYRMTSQRIKKDQ